MIDMHGWLSSLCWLDWDRMSMLLAFTVDNFVRTITFRKGFYTARMTSVANCLQTPDLEAFWKLPAHSVAVLQSCCRNRKCYRKCPPPFFFFFPSTLCLFSQKACFQRANKFGRPRVHENWTEPSVPDEKCLLLHQQGQKWSTLDLLSRALLSPFHSICYRNVVYVVSHPLVCLLFIFLTFDESRVQLLKPSYFMAFLIDL